MTDLNDLAFEIHQTALKNGWWGTVLEYADIQNRYNNHDRNMMLIISEFSEAMEGHRRDLYDDHLPEYKQFEVELADVLIRSLDVLMAYEQKVFVNTENIKKQLMVNTNGDDLDVPALLFKTIKYSINNNVFYQPQAFVNSVLAIVDICGIENFMGIVKAKMNYNKFRKDHTLEARNGKNGKKY